MKSTLIIRAFMISGMNQLCRYACSLLRQGMKQILISLETAEITAVEKTGDKNAIAKVIIFYEQYVLVCWIVIYLAF